MATSGTSNPRQRYRYAITSTLTLPGQVSSLAFSPDGLFLAAGIGRLVRIWEATDFHTSFIEYVAHETAETTCLVWNRHGLYCGYSTGEIAVISFSTITKNCRTYGFQASSHPVRFLALDASSEFMAVASVDGVRVWSLCKTGTPSDWIPMHNLPQPRGVPPNNIAEVTSLSWRPGKDAILIVSYRHHGIITWYTQRSEEFCAMIPGLVFGGCASPGGTHFAISSGQGKFELFDLEQGTYLHTFLESDPMSPPQNMATHSPVTFIHEGRCLLGGGIGGLNIWRLDTKQCIQTLELCDIYSTNHVQLICASSIGPEPPRIAACVQHHVITVWSASTQTLPSPEEKHQLPPMTSQHTSRQMAYGMLCLFIAVFTVGSALLLFKAM